MLDQNVANADSKHIAEELYKKNLELAEVNKSLALLRKIDEIVLSSVIDIKSVAHQVTDAVVSEAGFKAVYILLKDNKNRLLVPLAVSLNKSLSQIDSDLLRAIYSLKVPFTDESNIIIQAINDQKMQRTDNMFAIFKSYLTEGVCKKIQDIARIKYFHIYPLIIRDEAIGAFIISPKEESAPYFAYQENLIERLPGVISIAIDNTLLYQNIERTNIRLKELDILKDEFVSIASHELRTPLTAIKSYIWMTLNKSTDLNPQVKSYLEIAASEIEHLIKLVQNMLTISRIESQRLELTLENIDLYELVKQVFDTLKIKADEKQQTFILVPYPEKLLVSADKDKLTEVFENIIGNALKYTPDRGKITIHFSTGKDKTRIHITDTGPGISSDNQTKIFQKFGRLEEAKHNRTPGTGLGLYISKQITDLHKGSINVESELGKGSTFTVTLPMV
ncbi:hypothetical protein A2774_02100 [Candidatus Roizmanbacteria bacterium RIFCSPHIGHO2_01_FULL_39_12c]|uniref:histidine kinase n=1 Tax=Candidatus Roizmanbacteria bacterium RIFCSPHIGHO2_01_FULL_39_12c TaxID=1802031 RepID=A0A1F7GE03_9BACT|nr:MAG: hypothetical protein A2774_02100 [Candidatus Roizmanbacteria bacterium RIFCSPHIGHO2_01_FULL_39_12c]OGK47559.1 MAG: hypothetical protein A2963_00825 [Candidatus Roizmanbacteria bacterium RIFCSPLOWO2_01_FULL_40_13]